MQDNARRETERILDNMIARLTEIYTDAQPNVQKAADEFFQNFAALDKQKQVQVDKGIITEKEYEDWRTNKILYSQRFKHMTQQYAEELLHVNETAIDYVNEQLPEIYALNYNEFAKQAEYYGGMSFSLVDADTVRTLAETDGSLLPYKKLDPNVDVPWNMRKVNSEVLQGILTGESIPKIADRMAKVTNANRVGAVRTARTLVTGAENHGRWDGIRRMEANGIIVEKEWLATFDKRTRDSHAALNGETAAVDVPFSNGLLYPGDPNGAPSEVYNCRCTMLTNVKGFKPRSKK